MNLHFLDRIEAAARLKVKIRYRQPEQWASVIQTGPDLLEVEFDDLRGRLQKGSLLYSTMATPWPEEG